MEERRNMSLEAILVAVGEIKSIAHINNETLIKLDGRVATQNGRVAKLERWQAYTQGAVTVLILMVVPVIIKIVAEAFLK